MGGELTAALRSNKEKTGRERKKKSRKFTTGEDKNHSKHDKFIKLEFLENGKFTKYHFIGSKQEQKRTGDAL